jgi:hypothetical protein
LVVTRARPRAQGGLTAVAELDSNGNRDIIVRLLVLFSLLVATPVLTGVDNYVGKHESNGQT